MPRSYCANRNRAVVSGMDLVESALAALSFCVLASRGALFTIANFLIHIYMSVFAERGAFGSVIPATSLCTSRSVITRLV